MSSPGKSEPHIGRSQTTKMEMAIERMDNLVGEQGGSQELITILETLGGIRVGRNWSRKTMGFGMKSSINHEIEKDIVIKDLPGSYRRLLRKFTEKLVLSRKDSNLKELMLGRGTSIIQHLLFVLKVRSTELCDEVVKKSISIIFGDEDTRKSIITNSISAYLVETIILVASEKRLDKIWSRYLKGNLRDMWRDDIANFVVQRLVDAAQSEELYKEICDELLPHLDPIFSFNRPGIGVCLAKACQKFKHSQQDFIAALMEAFHCYKPKDKQVNLVPLMLFGYQQRKRDIWLHGSLMLQYIFGYKDVYKISKSLLSLDVYELVLVANDKSGSHVIDSFLQSESVATHHKMNFLEKLEGNYIHLAKDRFGSRIIDYLMSNGDAKIKEMIMEELSSKHSQLQATENGSYVARRTGTYHYRHRPDDWRRVEDMKRSRRDDDYEDDLRSRPIKRSFHNARPF